MINRIRNYIQNKLKNKSPIVTKLFGGMVWMVTGSILSKVFVMVASIFVARILGVDKNGEYGIINSTVLMFSTFAGAALGTTATRFIAEYKIDDKEKCGRIIALVYSFGMITSFIMAIVLVLLAPWLANNQLQAPHLVSPLSIAAVLLITNTINTIQVSNLAGFENFKAISKLSIVQGIITLPILITFTYLLKVDGVIIGNIVIGLVMLILFGIENKKAQNNYLIKLDYKNLKTEFKILWSFSLPSVLSNIMIGPIVWIGNVLVYQIAGGESQLGIFNAANQWRVALTFIPVAIGSVILPYIIMNKKNQRLEKINILFGWLIVNCFALPILAFPEAIAWLYGDTYQGQSFNISILMVVLICCVLSYKDGVARNLVRDNLMWWGVLDNALWGSTFLGVLWFARGWGAIGIAAAYLIAYFVTVIVFIPFYIRRGVVHRSLIISKEILFVWFMLIMQMLSAALTESIIIRGITFLFSALAIWRVTSMMLKREDNLSLKEENQ